MEPTHFLDRLGKLALVPIGLLLLASACWCIWSTKIWLTRAVEVRGSVIEMVRARDRDNTGYVFAPVVRFETPDGATIDFESNVRTYPPAYRVGQMVSVLYDPDEPRSAVIRGVLSLWLMPIILGFIGSIFLAIGVAMVLLGRYVGGGLQQLASGA